MAGWMAVWTRGELLLDPILWKMSVRSALKYGGGLSEHHTGGVALAAWRRDGGEFPLSGKIHTRPGAKIAWVGQCVEDAGDSTELAVSHTAAERFDDKLVASANGPFAAVVLRENPFEIRIVGDRYRHYPIYVYRGSRVTVASTEIRCIVPWMSKVALDQDSVDLLLRSGELFDRMTMLQGVELLPPATVLVDHGQGAEDRRYWSMRHDGSGATTLEKTADDLSCRISTAVRRLESATPRLGITLSGGLDSRLILDLCKQAEHVPSFTWGLPGCRDIKCASTFAALVKSPHTVKQWDTDAFPPVWSQGVDLTAGSYGVDSMFMLPFVPLLASSCNVVLNGLAGDAIMGGNFLKYSWLSETDIGALGRKTWRWRVAEEADSLVDRLVGRTSGSSSAAERWVASISAREGARPVERLNDWLYENRVFRYTNSGTMLLRAGVESHSPFFDRDFIDSVIHVRQEHKLKHRLYLEVMKRVAPRSASVAWQRTNIKPKWGYRMNLASMMLHRAGSMAGAAFGYKAFKSLAVADTAGWLRNSWRKQAQDILTSDQMNQRGLVDPGVVREIWNAHLNGADHTRQLGALIAVEIFARQVFEGEETVSAFTPLTQDNGVKT